MGKYCVLATAATTEHARRNITVSKSSAGSAVRPRAVLIGLVIVLLTTLLVTQAELVLSTLRIGYLQMPPIAISILVVAIAVNRIAGWLRRRWQLAPAELLTDYSMSLVAAMVSSHCIVEKLVPQ